jgi:hypothetical protein
MEKLTATVSTSAWINNPKELFKITSRLNTENNSPCNIELYPAYLTIPGVIHKITANEIEKWYETSECKYANIARIHLPFAYDFGDKIWRVFGDSNEPLSQRAFHGSDIFLTGYSRNNYGLKLGSDIGQIQGRNVGISLHSDVFLSYVKNNNLNDLQRPGLYPILIENEIGYKHRFFKKREIENIDDIVATKNRFNLDGLVFALDHFQMQGREVISVVRKYQKDIKTIHIAGKNHQPINFKEKNQEYFEELVDNFDHPVELVLDYAPFCLNNLNFQKRFNLIKEFTDFVRRLA